MQIPEEDRLAVKEVTLDLSSSMKDIVSTVFPNATIVLDCFHVLKRCHDAVEELRLRTKHSLTQSPDKWSEKQKERMDLLFEMYPKIKEAYWIVNGLRSIFRSKTLDKEAARLKLHEWYKTVSRCTSREMKSARNHSTPR